jgi:fermentation-respiration switch protein FrsA (DUF1100 family)
MSDPRQASTGIFISEENPVGFKKRDLLLQLSTFLRKGWRVLCLSPCLLCFSGCLSSILYHPVPELRGTPADVGLPYESVYLETVDGKRLGAWWIPCVSPRGVLLYCHGNGGNISALLDSVRIFNRLGMDLFVFDYRGYGESSGSPSEQGLYRDVEAAWNYLERIRRIDPQRIVVFGWSMGGPVAAWISQKQRPGALILEGAFTSLQEAARDRVPGFFVTLFIPDQYPTKRYVAMVQCPVLIIHSRDDEVMPFHHGETLFAAARGAKQLLVIRGSHNRGFLDSQYETSIHSFLSGVLGQKKEE